MGKIGIDFRLLSAQLVNFGLLLIVLYKFLYKPILAMLQKRTEMIERSIREAKQLEEDRKRAEEMRLKIIEQTKKEAAEILSQAKDLGTREREEILKKTKEEAERILAEAKISLLRDKELLIDSVRKETGALISLALQNIFKKRTVSPEEQEELTKEAVRSLEK